MPHYPEHFYMGVAALAATFLVWALTANRLVKRKLQLSLFLLAGYLAVHLLFLVRPELGGGNTDLTSPTRPFERLALTAALVNLFVISLINPLHVDRVRDRFPAIVQDAIVIGLLLIVATFAFQEQLLTTSAVGAVVVGLRSRTPSATPLRASRSRASALSRWVTGSKSVISKGA